MNEEEGIIFDELHIGEGTITVVVGNGTQQYIGFITLRIVNKNGRLFSVRLEKPKLRSREFNAQHVLCWTTV